MKRSDIEHLRQAIETRTPVAQLTWIETGHQKLVERSVLSDAELPDDLAAVITESFRTDRSGIHRSDGQDVFVRIYNPRLRLVIVGAVHIAQALIPYASQNGYEIIVVDPRTAFAAEARFETVQLDPRWPDEALPDIGIDPRTAFIALTHDPKIDDPALTYALSQKPFYIGALGSRRTHQRRIERLTANGISEECLSRIHAPIGLDIGAIGANEIALSVLAEITATLRGKKLQAA